MQGLQPFVQVCYIAHISRLHVNFYEYYNVDLFAVLMLLLLVRRFWFKVLQVSHIVWGIAWFRSISGYFIITNCYILGRV